MKPVVTLGCLQGLRCWWPAGRAGLVNPHTTARHGPGSADGCPNERQPAGRRPPSEGGRPQDDGGGGEGGSGLPDSSRLHKQKLFHVFLVLEYFVVGCWNYILQK